jgi:uncharacterized membrane protein YccC
MSIQDILIGAIVGLAVVLLLLEQWDNYKRGQIARRTRKYARRAGR